LKEQYPEERPWVYFARNTEADSYTAKKRMACNNQQFQMESCQPIKRFKDKEEE
jgi:hypothetical protein